MTIFQAFCCTLGPAVFGMGLSYVTITVIAKIAKKNNSHTDT
jgi:hypothetical protein